MLERLLSGVAAHRGVTDAWLVEADGFVLYRKEAPHSQPPTQAVHDWLALAQNAGTSQTVTLVQENGYVLLTHLPVGTFIVKAQRDTNLGSLRLSLQKLSNDLLENES